MSLGSSRTGTGGSFRLGEATICGFIPCNAKRIVLARGLIRWGMDLAAASSNPNPPRPLGVEATYQECSGIDMRALVWTAI